MVGSMTRFFVLSGIVVHELDWLEVLDDLINFRQSVRQGFGIKLTEEIHSAQLLTKPGSLVSIPKHKRLSLIRIYADYLAQMGKLSIVNVVVDKMGKPNTYDPFESAWKALIQRFENTIARRNFTTSPNQQDRGLMICDQTSESKLRLIVRKMRRYNPIPNQSGFGTGHRNLRLRQVLEDPSMRNSRDSLYIQSADLCAFLLYQSVSPNAYVKKHGATNYLHRLGPILCKSASSSDPLGVVRL